jgi:hypothetical protein
MEGVYEVGIEALFIELVQNVQTLGSRMRLAVSAEEFRQIRDHMLATDGRFYNKIRDIPLIIEEGPAKPLLTVEYAWKESTKWA